MIQVDGCQYGDQWTDDVGGVQSTAETGFKDDKINTMGSEIVERQVRS